MKIKYNIEALDHIIKDLSTLTGMSISFLDTEFNHLILSSKENDYCSVLQQLVLPNNYCFKSDMDILLKCKQSRKLESHICHAGLCDSAMPIIKNEKIAGYIIFGRIRTCSSPGEQIYKDNKKISNILKVKYDELTYFTNEQIDSFYDLLPRILFQNAIEIEDEGFIKEVSEYIKTNISEKITISSLCKKFFVSKNRLYDAFKNHYECTVNEFVTEQRLIKAKEMIKKSNEPIYKIAESVGFENYTYFCKLFKRKVGMTPYEYKKAVVF